MQFFRERERDQRQAHSRKNDLAVANLPRRGGDQARVSRGPRGLGGADALNYSPAGESSAAFSGGGPTLIECVTYRLGVHTTADDPTRYRSDEEVRAWERKDPLPRARAYLEKKNLLDDGLEAQVDEEIARAVERFETMAEADPLTIFDHVFAERPAHLEAQRAELRERLDADPPRRVDEERPLPTPMRGQRKTSRWAN